jgi:2-polyprenyl-3-methyl-5-hydroxy-6-metoxy-1,4-benzoquinol methylase
LSGPAGRGGDVPGPFIRFPHRSYGRCLSCGIIYLFRAVKPAIEYDRNYFFDFYKEQYGKTYLEDFPHLKEMGRPRIRRIRRLLKRPGEKVPEGPEGEPVASPVDKRFLLDIGCAYGPFMAAAAEAGFYPVGIDPAEDAVNYVREKLKFPVFQASFPDIPPTRRLEPESFDALTLWFVIEHFRNPLKALGEANRLLKPGGVLAFSTPSSRGISCRKSRRKFLAGSPEDHWTIWNPRSARFILEQTGFTLVQVLSTGHHPERFPLAGGFIGKKRGILYRLLCGLSRVFALGDTFEVYAVKKGDPV